MCARICSSSFPRVLVQSNLSPKDPALVSGMALPPGPYSRDSCSCLFIFHATRIEARYRFPWLGMTQHDSFFANLAGAERCPLMVSALVLRRLEGFT